MTDAATAGATGIVRLLQEFHRDKLAALLRHEAAARRVGQYDFNNAYQYIINREEAQLSWIAKAIEELGAAVPDAPPQAARRPGAKSDAARGLMQEDATDAQSFVDRWRPRIDGMPNARHAKMLRVILGEVLEAKRFFDQAAAGQTDLLGRRGATLGPSHGDVLASRWIE